MSLSMARFSLRHKLLAGSVAVAATAATLTASALAGPGGGGTLPQPLPLKHEPGGVLTTQRVMGGMPEGAYQQALAQAKALGAETAVAAPGTARTKWDFKGPVDIGGRLLDVVLDPKDTNTVYVASAGGGVWRSRDTGMTFEQAWPADEAQAVGALVMAPDGKLWAGTGETGPGGGSTTFEGNGVWTSANGGKTWKNVGLEDSRRVGKIAVDPTDPNTVYVAASGDLYHPGGQRGLYKTTNGGASWSRVLAPATDTAGATDIAMDPSDPDTLYVTTWDHQRTAPLRKYGGVGSRFYKTTDGGATWTELGQDRGLITGTADTGRLSVVVSPSNPDRVYFLRIDSLGGFGGMWRSSDAGATWTQLPNNNTLRNSQSSYGWWFGAIFVHPTNPDEVYVPGVPLIKSSDAGQTWTTIARNVHSDHQALVWDTRIPGRMYDGSDGGLSRSDDAGATWTKARVEPYTQFYTVDVAENDVERIVGGTQDNGCNRSYGGTTPEAWDSFACGDGLETVINPGDPGSVIACSQYGSCNRYIDGGDRRPPGESSITSKTASQRRGWKAPIEHDVADPNVTYYAGNIVNRSPDKGVTWSAISPDLTSGVNPDPQYPYATVTTVAAKGQRVYAGTDEGWVWRTDDGGANWKRLDANLPKRWVTRIRLDPANADIVYVTFNGFKEGVKSAHVFRSTNAGESWTDISGNLPNAPVNDLVLVGKTVVVASDVGAFISRSGRAGGWDRLGQGLPQIPVFELRHQAATDTITAATFGRGIYRLEMPAGLVAMGEISARIDQLVAAGSVTSATAAGLQDRLARAASLAGEGSETRTIAYLEQFVSRVNNQVRNAAARAELVSAARAIINELQALEDGENS